MISRADLIYNYKLYSLKRIPKFIKYSIPRAKAICENGGGKYWPLILVDMLWCNLIYGTINSEEYLLFRFFEKSHNERKQYFTRREYYRLIKSFDYETFTRLAEKQNQYVEYANFVNRKWMIANAKTSLTQIAQFVDTVGQSIAKPISSDCGKGVEKIRKGDNEKIKHLHESIKDGVYLLEECLENCTPIKEINPSSLNTLRITYVLRQDGTPHIFSAMLRTGISKAKVVDNWGAGGILMNVNIETGTIDTPGYDESGKQYNHHPISNIELVGFKIPQFEKAIEFSKEVASVNPKVIFGGLDLAITDDGIKLVEINFPPANVAYQVFGKGYKRDIMEIRK